ncbi:MAG: metallophosphoesterase [Acidimicrobiia bacterium]
MAEPTVRAISDVHDAPEALGRVAASGGPLLVLGDFLNFIDYRTGRGMVADVLGLPFARRAAAARGSGTDARGLWMEAIAGYDGDFAAELRRHAVRQYEAAAAAIAGAEVYATFGNVDHPGLLREIVGGVGVRVLHGEAVEIGELTYGFVGGGRRSPFGDHDELGFVAALDRLGPVDVLCTHVPPAVPALYRDVVTGLDEKHAPAISAYLAAHRPRLHLFGDVHQPRATRWRVGPTTCVNVGYFRATGRPTIVMTGGRVC